MKLKEAIIIHTGYKSLLFEYGINCAMNIEIAKWLQDTFTGGYGVGYYYSHNWIYFKKEFDVTAFKLRFNI